MSMTLDGLRPVGVTEVAAKELAFFAMGLPRGGPRPTRCSTVTRTPNRDGMCRSGFAVPMATGSDATLEATTEQT